MSHGYSVDTIQQLKNVPGSGRFTSRGRVSLLVNQLSRWYTFDPDSTLPDDPTDFNVVAPSSGTGRWIGHGNNSGQGGSITFAKDLVDYPPTINKLNFTGNNITGTLSQSDTVLSISVSGGGGAGVSGWESLFGTLSEWESVFLGL